MRYMIKNLKCNVALTGSQRPLKIGFSSTDAEQILKHIPASSDCYEKAKDLLVNIQRDSDGDGWCDAIEIEWGSDPHDPESIPRKWVK